MTNITNATDWRSLSNPLTPAQVAESDQLQARFAHIPVPAECIGQPGLWDGLDDEDGYQRTYTCWQHPQLGDTLFIVGQQNSDGTINRFIYSTFNVEETDADTARAIARALLAAADQLDALEAQQ